MKGIKITHGEINAVWTHYIWILERKTDIFLPLSLLPSQPFASHYNPTVPDRQAIAFRLYRSLNSTFWHSECLKHHQISHVIESLSSFLEFKSILLLGPLLDLNSVTEQEKMAQEAVLGKNHVIYTLSTERNSNSIDHELGFFWPSLAESHFLASRKTFLSLESET